MARAVIAPPTSLQWILTCFHSEESHSWGVCPRWKLRTQKRHDLRLIPLFWPQKITLPLYGSVHGHKTLVDFTHFESLHCELNSSCIIWQHCFCLCSVCGASCIPMPWGSDMMITRSVQVVSLHPENTSKKTKSKSGLKVSAAGWTMAGRRSLMSFPSKIRSAENLDFDLSVYNV